MARYKMLVLSRPTAGREAEYNDWYQGQHLKEVLAVPGFVSAQRFRLAANLMQGVDVAPYAAIYEIESSDLPAALHELTNRAGGETLFVSEALDLSGVFAAVYEEFGSVVKA